MTTAKKLAEDATRQIADVLIFGVWQGDKVQAIVESAIEKVDDMWRERFRQFDKIEAKFGPAVQRAAHEQELHDKAIEFSELVWFATLVEPYVANQYCHEKDDLSRKLYDACVKIRVITDKYSKNIPANPSRAAHASEQQHYIVIDEHEKREGDWQAGAMWFRPVPAHASESDLYRISPVNAKYLSQEYPNILEPVSADDDKPW